MWFRLEAVLVIIGGILLWVNTLVFELLDSSGREIVYNNVEGYTKDWNLNGENTSLGVSKKG